MHNCPDSSLNLLAQHPVLINAAEQWLTDTSSLKRRANAALLLANMARTGIYIYMLLLDHTVYQVHGILWMINCTEEMCEIFITHGMVPHLIHLTQIEEPEEVYMHVHIFYIDLTQYIPTFHRHSCLGRFMCLL